MVIMVVIGSAVEAEGAMGAVQAEHIAFTSWGVFVRRAEEEEPCGE